MEFDDLTVVIMLIAPDPPEFSEEEVARLQDAHLNHLATLHDQGALVAAGPANGGPADRMRSICIFQCDETRARRLISEDPIVVSGRFEFTSCRWMVPRNAMRFTPALFPRSVNEALGTWRGMGIGSAEMEAEEAAAQRAATPPESHAFDPNDLVIGDFPPIREPEVPEVPVPGTRAAKLPRIGVASRGKGSRRRRR